MNVTTLYNMQKQLDKKIETQHQLEKESLIERKILALLVEVGELANETRCFKFWSLKAPATTDVILEEFVDGIHFILSLGLEIGTESAVILEEKTGDHSLTEQFLRVYQEINSFQMDHTKENHKQLFEEYLLLGNLLGFSADQVEQAYVSKNEVNHQRQEQGY
ncbi:dUTP diphosphatase [Metabacillus sp. HB246100]